MREPELTSIALPPTSPAAAYATDLERLQQPGPLGQSDDAWLMLGHVYERLACCSAEEAREIAPRSADLIAISAVAIGQADGTPVLRAARALRALESGEQQPLTAYDPLIELAVATQAIAEQQELAGAFALAYATLYSLLAAFGDRIPARAHGNALAQMGRASRQFGALDLAGNLYDDAIALGYECEALDVVARGLLGRGTLAVTRGNYPSGREHFERALVNADLSGDTELIRSAHHGLQHIGIASGDLDAAMVHGWNVLRLCIAPDPRAEALLNMAELCRMSGEHEAALRTYAVALEWTSQVRVRLHALCGALQSAIAAHRAADAQRFVRQITEALPNTLDAYNLTVIYIDFADALQKLGETGRASEHLASALTIARRNSFHELIHRAEQAANTWQHAPAPIDVASTSARRKRPRRSEHFRRVLRSLNGLTIAAR
jgi:tetratricopeptide (TPR) repeat protein